MIFFLKNIISTCNKKLCNYLKFKILCSFFCKKKYKFTLFSALNKGKNLKFGFFDLNCDEAFFRGSNSS